MRQILAKMMVVIAFFAVSFSVLALVSNDVWADCNGVETAILGDGGCYETEGTGNSNGIYKLLGTVIKILTYLIAVLGTVGLVISGIQYMTAGGNEAQVAKAKARIIEIVIGLVAYGLMAAFLNFIIPGGVF